jgi:MFS family permease
MERQRRISDFMFRLSILFLVLGISAAAVAPSERTIGKALSLVYLHIGFFLAALILLILSLIASAFGVRYEKARRIANTSFSFASLSWLIYFVLSAAVAYLGWGGIFWQEPRMVIAVRVLILLSAAMVLVWVMEERAKNLVISLASLLSIIIWLGRYSIFHPKAPIRNSDNLSIKALAVISIAGIVISVLMLASAVFLRDEKS